MVLGPGREAAARDIFRKWELDFAVVGRVTDTRHLVLTQGGEVVADISYHGAELKKGEMVALATVLGGLDEEANPDPMKVDFQRRGARHVTFGTGPHRCPGALLARTEMRIAIEEWLKRIPDFDLHSDMVTTFSGGVTASMDEVRLSWDPAITSAG